MVEGIVGSTGFRKKLMERVDSVRPDRRKLTRVLWEVQNERRRGKEVAL